MIRIVNLKFPDLYDGENMIRVCRPTALGNPFPLKKESDRDLVCDKYEAWLNENQNDPNVKAMLEYIRQESMKGNVALACWCHPKRCHAESIIKFLSR
jgi:hypothetical protein